MGGYITRSRGVLEVRVPSFPMFHTWGVHVGCHEGFSQNFVPDHQGLLGYSVVRQIFVFVFHYVRVLDNQKIPRVLSTEKPLLV